MTVGGGLLAWIEIDSAGGVVAAIVGTQRPDHAPARHPFDTQQAAVEWVETEAAALGVPVEWADLPSS